MTKKPKRIRLKKGLDILALAEEVKADKEPRILESYDRAIAALVSLEDLDRLLLSGPSSEGIERALSVAGAWSDVDGDELIRNIYRARHESPPSPPISL